MEKDESPKSSNIIEEKEEIGKKDEKEEKVNDENEV